MRSFGILSFATYFVTLFAATADFGLQPILTREIARAPDRAGPLVWNGLLLKAALTGGALLCMGGILLVSGFDPETVRAVVLSMALFGLTSLSTVFLGALQGRQKMLLTSLLALVQDLLNSAAVIAVIARFPSITTVLSIGIAAAALNLALCACVAAGAAVLSSGIMALIYPPEFDRSAAAFAILLGSCAVGHLNWVMTTFLAAVDRQRFIMFATLIVAALVVAANLLIVPGSGYLATAWIVASAEGALFVASSVYLIRGGFPFRPAAILGKPVAAAALMALALLLAPRMPVLVHVLLGVLLYGVLIVAMGGLGEQERRIIRGVFGR